MILHFAARTIQLLMIFTKIAFINCYNKLCGSRHNMPRPSPPSVGAEAPRVTEPTAPDRNVAVGSHDEYVPMVTAAAA